MYLFYTLIHKLIWYRKHDLTVIKNMFKITIMWQDFQAIQLFCWQIQSLSTYFILIYLNLFAYLLLLVFQNPTVNRTAKTSQVARREKEIDEKSWGTWRPRSFFNIWSCNAKWNVPKVKYGLVPVVLLHIPRTLMKMVWTKFCYVKKTIKMNRI